MQLDSDIVATCKAMSTIVKTCAGPSGRPIGIMAAHDVELVTSSDLVCAQIVKIPMCHPSLKMLCNAAMLHKKRCGDGGWMLVHLVAETVCQVQKPEFEYADIFEVVSALEKVISWMTFLLNCANVFFDCPPNAPAMVVMVRHFLATCGVPLTIEEKTHLGTLAVRAFLECLTPKGVRLGNVRFLVLPSSDEFSGVSASSLEEGVIIPWSLPPEARFVDPTFGLFLLFDCDLQPCDKTELSELRNTIDELLRSCNSKDQRVVVLASQRTIHPSLRWDLAQRHRVVPLERLSIRHIASVQLCTGAKVFSSWRTVLTQKESVFEMCGHGVTLEAFGEGSLMRLRGSSSPMSTMVIRTLMEEYQRPLEAAMTNSIVLLREYFTESRVVPGREGFAGAFLSNFIELCGVWSYRSGSCSSQRLTIDALQLAFREYHVRILSGTEETWNSLRREIWRDFKTGLCQAAAATLGLPFQGCGDMSHYKHDLAKLEPPQAFWGDTKETGEEPLWLPLSCVRGSVTGALDILQTFLRMKGTVRLQHTQ